MKKPSLKNPTSNADDRTVKIAGHVRAILNELGLNPNDPSTSATPMRVAKMYTQEIFSSLFEQPPVVTVFPNTKKYNHFVVERDITIASTCEHHLVPFIGKCHIVYKPGKFVCGLSKLNRVAEYFAKKPQIQERLGTEILEFLQKELKTKDVAVIVDCKHLCVSCRGIKDVNSSTVTSHLGGIFNDSVARAEMFNLINL